MTCTITSVSSSDVVFVIQCDDARIIEIRGHYHERFHLAEILQEVVDQLPVCSFELQSPGSRKDEDF